MLIGGDSPYGRGTDSYIKNASYLLTYSQMRRFSQWMGRVHICEMFLCWTLVIGNILMVGRSLVHILTSVVYILQHEPPITLWMVISLHCQWLLMQTCNRQHLVVKMTQQLNMFKYVETFYFLDQGPIFQISAVLISNVLLSSLTPFHYCKVVFFFTTD